MLYLLLYILLGAWGIVHNPNSEIKADTPNLVRLWSAYLAVFFPVVFIYSAWQEIDFSWRDLKTLYIDIFYAVKTGVMK